MLEKSPRVKSGLEEKRSDGRGGSTELRRQARRTVRPLTLVNRTFIVRDPLCPLTKVPRICGRLWKVLSPMHRSPALNYQGPFLIRSEHPNTIQRPKWTITSHHTELKQFGKGVARQKRARYWAGLVHRWQRFLLRLSWIQSMDKIQYSCTDQVRSLVTLAFSDRC